MINKLESPGTCLDGGGKEQEEVVSSRGKVLLQGGSVSKKFDQHISKRNCKSTLQLTKGSTNGEIASRFKILRACSNNILLGVRVDVMLAKGYFFFC